MPNFFFTGLNNNYCHCIEDEVVSLLLKVILLFLCEKMINIQHQTEGYKQVKINKLACNQLCKKQAVLAI